jgi:hypothetical protein
LEHRALARLPRLREVIEAGLFKMSEKRRWMFSIFRMEFVGEKNVFDLEQDGRKEFLWRSRFIPKRKI